MRKIAAKILALTCAEIMLAGCSSGAGGGQTTAPEQTAATTGDDVSADTKAETPPAEDSFVVYNTSKEEEMVIHLNRFEKETGIHGETVRLSAGEALGRITVERENPKNGVWFGGGIDSYIQAKEEGLLEPYFSPTAAAIPAEYKDPEGYYTGAYLTYLVIAYNKTLLDEKGVAAPTSWQDLLDPAYKGQITMANPEETERQENGESFLDKLFAVQISS